MLGHLSITTVSQALAHIPVTVTVPDTVGMTLLVADTVGINEGETDGVNDIVDVRVGVMVLLGVQVFVAVVVGERVCVTVVVGVSDGVTANIYSGVRSTTAEKFCKNCESVQIFDALDGCLPIIWKGRKATL